MTSATSVPRASNRRAFTLVEMLVAMGIALILGSLLLLGVTRAYRSAYRTRTAAMLQILGAGLEAYKTDHGEYPPVDPIVAPGAVTLCRALAGMAPAPVDGADGPGFRLRGMQGRVYGPYVQLDRMVIDDDMEPANSVGNPAMAVFRDAERRPVLYFRAALNKPNIHANTGFVSQTNGGGLYNADENLNVIGNIVTIPPSQQPTLLTAFRHLPNEPVDVALARIRGMLGDFDNNGRIDLAQGESPATTAPYLLWAAGNDGFFGPHADLLPPRTDRTRTTNCDDITSFQGN